MAVAHAALDATVETIRPDGAARSIPIAEFHRLPGDTPHIETVLEPGELITAVTLPKPLGGTHIYRKVRDRASFAFALVSVAAIVQPDGTAAWRWAASRTSRGASRRPSRDAARREGGCAQLLAGARTTDDNAFKLQLVERTLALVLAEAKGLSHEIRHARHHQSDRSAQGRRQADGSDRRPAQDDRHGDLRLRVARRVVPNPAYGYIVGSAIAKGRIRSWIWPRPGPRRACSPSSRRRMPASSARAELNTARLLGGPEIQHYHQAIALVVAETFEQARAAAQLVRVDYVREPRARSIWPRPRTPQSRRS